MSDRTILHGCVLSSMPMGENDRRIVLLTREEGCISAFARGARRQNNPLGAASSPFTFGAFEAYRGRNSWTVTACDVQSYFTDMLTSVDNIYYGSYFAEIAEFYGQEGNDESDRVNLLFVTLKALEKKAMSLDMIRRIYELRTLVINGEYPDFFHCVISGSTEDLHSISISKRGAISDEMRQSVRDCEPVSDSVLYALRYVTTAPITRLYAFRLKPEAEEVFCDFLRRYRNRYKERTYHSEAFLT
ncbi:MAG: DNA repair protein RecO [Lachnospiraceae bacterium]|nr:DNA repair protein RecO [Lachnospiraceae bacterium]